MIKTVDDWAKEICKIEDLSDQKGIDLLDEFGALSSFRQFEIIEELKFKDSRVKRFVEKFKGILASQADNPYGLIGRTVLAIQESVSERSDISVRFTSATGEELSGLQVAEAVRA